MNLIEPVLYWDHQQQKPAAMCDRCGGECYAPSLLCLRCGRKNP